MTNIKAFFNDFFKDCPAEQEGRPLVMGIVNVTPDSFSDGGLHLNTEAAIQHGLRLIHEGADILDVGGESTRPNALPVHPDSEIERVIPVITGLKEVCLNHNVKISVDTRNSQTMQEALNAGADIINDVTALKHDPKSRSVVKAAEHVPVILMHIRGTPESMQQQTEYTDVVLDIQTYFEDLLKDLEKEGINPNHCILDVGIGFAKTAEQNAALIKGLDTFHRLNCPLLLGASRKSFIAKLAEDNSTANERIGGSITAALCAMTKGVQILRVHDVAATVQACRIWSFLK